MLDRALNSIEYIDAIPGRNLNPRIANGWSKGRSTRFTSGIRLPAVRVQTGLPGGAIPKRSPPDTCSPACNSAHPRPVV